MSILKSILKRKFWRKAADKIVKPAKTLFSKGKRGVASGWRGVKKMWSKNPEIRNGILTGVGSYLAINAISRMFGGAEEAAVADEIKYGTSDPDALISVKKKRHIDELIATLERMRYISDVDSMRFKQELLSMIALKHDFIMSLSDDGVDFGCTADRLLGAVYRSGLCPENGVNNDYVLNMMVNAKDDDTSPLDVQADMMNLIYFDSFRIPLRVN